MDTPTNIWLVANPASGSNDEAALKALKNSCESEGLCLARHIAFPKEDLPTPAELDEAGIGIVAVHAGDGTINALVDALDGWGGKVLVLPGGTMNLLSIRLHGPRSTQEIVTAAARGNARSVRLSVVKCDEGVALAGLLVGPATSWSDVREAMRDFAVAEILGDTIEAISRSTGGNPVRCADPKAGKQAGYPLLMLTPEDGHFTVKGYHADNLLELAQQGFAIMRRNFREGPHDDLGDYRDMVIEGEGTDHIDILIDGEPAQLGARARFTLGQCGVDLLATGEE